jgi:tetratricopeptide (TPR) repeat protein/transcriptional regulator with XRE-family HTH domain
MAEVAGDFAGTLRELRKRARFTQQELADAAGVSLRTVSDLERSVAATPQRETVRLLGDALRLIGAERARFETAARGRPLEVAPAAAVAMRSLPRDVASFTGRQRELDQLTSSAVAAGGVVGIHAIGGMAGVGKTAFAVHAAHRLAGRFPAGQIFLPLHGHTPGQQPVEPADALASLLLAAGIPPTEIPQGLEARAALWRNQIADKPLLLVLDDAAGSEQVQPLLPGTGGSLVLVTSRRHLSALDDATALSLDTLPPGDAAALLVRLAGRPGLRPSDPGVGEISGLCGYLPLAVGMMARQLRHHPSWTAAHRAAELASARDRLGLMRTENLSVAAAFDLSYADLTEDQQRLFRRLGLHLGTDIDGYVAAALGGDGLSAGRTGLEALYDQYLLTESAQGRYRLHDLLREHARTLARQRDPDEECEAAVDRLLDYYQHTSALANARIARKTRPAGAANGPLPAEVPAIADQEQALAWARTERGSLLACLDYVGAAGQHARVIALTAGISELLRFDGPLVDAVRRHSAAIAAARQLGDRLGHANALNDLAGARWMTVDGPAAQQALEEALDIYQDLGNTLGQANVLSNLGAVLAYAGDYPSAVKTLDKALDAYRDLGDRRGQALALSVLGDVGRLTADPPAAARALEEALSIYCDLGDRFGQANTLLHLADVRELTGDYPAAAQAVQEALGIHQDLGDRRGQANALYDLGKLRRLTGEYPAAAQALEEALAVYSELGDRLGEGNTRLELGKVWRLTGEYPAAVQAVEEALAIYRAIGSLGGEIEASNERGTLYRISGEIALARGCHEWSLDVARELDSSLDEAHALVGLGRCALAEDAAAQGEGFLRQALEIFRRTGAPDAQGLEPELDALAVGSRPAG